MEKPIMAYHNDNCDGSGPCSRGEVRVLPLSGQSNIILCERCFDHELTWRRARNKELAVHAKFDLPQWATLEVYAPVAPFDEPDKNAWANDHDNLVLVAEHMRDRGAPADAIVHFIGKPWHYRELYLEALKANQREIVKGVPAFGSASPQVTLCD